MLQECLQVFKEEYAKKGDKLILDSYIPADGTYILVGNDGIIQDKMEVKMDKES